MIHRNLIRKNSYDIQKNIASVRWDECYERRGWVVFGGALTGRGLGCSDLLLRWSRIFLMTVGFSIQAMILTVPPHWLQVSLLISPAGRRWGAWAGCEKFEQASSPKADIEPFVHSRSAPVFESPHRKKTNGSKEYIASKLQFKPECPQWTSQIRNIQ